AEAVMVDQVEEGREYAILLSTNAGAWRYLIGDVVRFTSKEQCEIVITGRTKHFLSLCGEHLSVDNMNKAIELTSTDLNIDVKEFTVIGDHFESMFAHYWYIGTDNAVDPVLLKQKIDEHLKVLNDDYRTERTSALKEVFVSVLPTETFYKWMEEQGKVGGQNKFPRVLKKEKATNWQQFVDKLAL
ncbi:MAG: GH3 auxin-responsive promoter family protein, partial [Cyclobacteriaceae bacterium]